MIDRAFVQAALVPLTYRITVMRKEERICIDKNVMIHANVISEKLFGLKTVMVRIHLGKIIDLTQNSVWIEPVQQRSSFDSGFGYYDAYANGGCDLCGGLSRCDSCGFGCGGGFSSCGCGGNVVAVVVVAAAGVAAVVAGVLNSDLVSSSELH